MVVKCRWRWYGLVMRYLLLVVMGLLGACAAPPSGARKVVMVETRKPIHVGQGTTQVEVRVKKDATVVRIDRRVFVCRGYEGYTGQIKAGAGWIRVGKVEMRYDHRMIQVRGSRTWVSFDRQGRKTYEVAQDGKVAQSIFRE